MGKSGSVASRLREERERLGYTAHQMASLAGVTRERYAAFEDGKEPVPIDFTRSLARFGARPVYIGLGGEIDLKGERQSETKGALTDWFYAEYGDEFPAAVRLMLRSVDAVNAFMGDGAADKHPQLVAALMHSTLAMERWLSPGEREELVDKIVGAIDGVADQVAQLSDAEGGGG